MRIVFMHHAKKDNFGEENQKPGFRNQANRLSEDGIKELKVFREIYKKNLSFSAIYVGEFKRYKLTADIININNAPIYIDKRLNESGSDEEFYGIIVNSDNKKEVFARHTEVLRQRTHEFLNDIIKKHNNDENILCVSSGVNLGEFMSYFYGGDKKEGLEISYSFGLGLVVFQYYKN